MIIRTFNNIELERNGHALFTVKNLASGFNFQTRLLSEAKRAWINQVFELDQDSDLFPLDYNIMSLNRFKKEIASLNTCKIMGWTKDENSAIFNDIWQAWEVDIKQNIAFTSFAGDKAKNAIAIIENNRIIENVDFAVSELSRPAWFITSPNKQTLDLLARNAPIATLKNI